MIIAHDQLRPETLTALIEDFVSRDGAIHGHSDTPVNQKVAAVLKLLKQGEALIAYNEEDESFSIVPAT